MICKVLCRCCSRPMTSFDAPTPSTCPTMLPSLTLHNMLLLLLLLLLSLPNSSSSLFLLLCPPTRYFTVQFSERIGAPRSPPERNAGRGVSFG